MALIQCPECNQLISDRASKCPKCGFPIQVQSDAQPEEATAGNDSPLENTPANPPKRKSLKRVLFNKKWVFIVAACLAVIVVLAIVFSSRSITVEDISISKWRLTDSSEYFDCYEGIVSSEQKRPFVAVIGYYDDTESTPEFVYVEDGTGVLETYELSDDDPSVEYRPIGYLTGDSVDESDMKIKCSDSDYNDWEYSHSSNCDVSIEINMNRAKTGLLIFDIENETNNETVRNKMAVVVNGKAQCNYYASLPYKARGIDVTVVPKFFCESVAVTQNDYTIEKPYTAKKGESSYFGEEALSFSNFDDGLILYTSELKDGGYKEKRNIVNNETVFLHNGKCSFTTSDPFDKDDTVLMPKYELNIVGYITWTLLEKET